MPVIPGGRVTLAGESVTRLTTPRLRTGSQVGDPRLALRASRATSACIAVEEQSQDLGQYLLRLSGQLFLTRAGQGVPDEREGVRRCAVCGRDGLAIRHESVSADGCDGNTASLQEDAVEHTAR